MCACGLPCRRPPAVLGPRSASFESQQIVSKCRTAWRLSIMLRRPDRCFWLRGTALDHTRYYVRSIPPDVGRLLCGERSRPGRESQPATRRGALASGRRRSGVTVGRTRSRPGEGWTAPTAGQRRRRASGSNTRSVTWTGSDTTGPSHTPNGRGRPRWIATIPAAPTPTSVRTRLRAARSVPMLAATASTVANVRVVDRRRAVERQETDRDRGCDHRPTWCRRHVTPGLSRIPTEFTCGTYPNPRGRWGRPTRSRTTMTAVTRDPDPLAAARGRRRRR